MKINILFFLSLLSLSIHAQSLNSSRPQVKIGGGWVQGARDTNNVKSFKGIPYAQPPVGELRWREPQPVKGWSGVKVTERFSAKPPQTANYPDMVSRSAGQSEDCLYLNIWTPASRSGEKLPVLVYFYGGGFVSGDGSENRYDGTSMARKGVVTVTLNYRLGIFGLFSHPELTKESVHHSSGNYGLMDQHAALVWVKNNIAAFGGDPQKVTIGGESAGSMSVSAQMASPLSKGLFRGAIGESGSILGTASPAPLNQAEQAGIRFSNGIGKRTIAELRRISAGELLKLSQPYHFPLTVDGYLLPESPEMIFATGRQMDIPLLAGWNSAEVDYRNMLGTDAPTIDNYQRKVRQLYGRHADDVLKAYVARSDSDVLRAATDLASDRFIVFNTWKWIDLHGKTNGYPVYRYLFARQPEPVVLSQGNGVTALGAKHAVEIDYGLGNLASNHLYQWTPGDKQVSTVMQGYLVNFIKSGDPNGPGLPKWYGMQSSIPKVQILDVNTKSEPEKNLRRYLLLDKINAEVGRSR